MVRDLHDRAQQRLVQTIITLKLARRAFEREPSSGPELVGEALEHAERANVEVRELVHGILPAALESGGLSAGVEALAARTRLPVHVTVAVDRRPARVEATAYFVIAEALTNVTKHAQATRAAACAQIADGGLRLRISDDGIGGARPDGTGFVGLADRLAVLDGRLEVDSAADGGTIVVADIPS